MKKINYLKFSLLTVLSGILFLTNASAQKIDKDKVYTYKIIENDPSHSNNFVLNADPVYIDLYSPNMNFGFGAGASFRFRNIVEISAYGYKSYLDRLNILDDYYNNKTGGVPAGGDKPASFSHFGAAFFFAKSLNEVKDKYLATKQGNTEYYIEIPAEALTLYGVRAGLQSFTTFIQSTNGDIKFTGTHKDGYGAPELTFNGDEYGTMMNSKVLNFGLVRKRIHDLRYQVESFSKKNHVESTEIFADILLATSIQFDDMKIYQVDTTVNNNMGSPSIASGTYSVDEKIQKSKLGARAGINYFYHLGLLGFNTGAEFGFRPGVGPISLGMYGVLKFGITLGTRVNI